MSLGNKTKCDLSAGIAKLDVKALTKQTENHFYSLITMMKNEVSDVRNNSLTEEQRKDALLSMVSHRSDLIKRLSEQIAETSELLYTLYNIDDRNVEVI
jgi:hypothetical protein